MQSNDQATARDVQAVDLISAVARGDANVGDIAAQLRKQGFDALDVVLAIVARASAAPRERLRAQRFIDIQQFSKRRPSDAVAKTVHRVPYLPFLLNGTLYDPKDINRFDGRELHMIAASPGEPLLVIDDPETMARWWQFSFLSSRSAAGLYAALEKYQYGGSQSSVEPQFVPFPPMPEPELEKPKPTQGSSGGSRSPGTYFYEHMEVLSPNRGDELHLSPNRGYYDLTEVSRGFLGSGDWNDIISAIWMAQTSVCVLHEHIHWQGSTLTITLVSQQAYGSPLANVGWNDRASSLETW
jgi:hypothetical protein